MISKSTIVLSLLSVLPHIHAQTLSCDGSLTDTVANIAAGASADIALAPGISALLSYSGCGSTVSHSMQLLDAGNVAQDTCPEADAGCSSRCIIFLEDTFLGSIRITNEDPVATGDLSVTIECNVTTTFAPTNTPTESPITPAPSTPAPVATPAPVTPAPTTTTTSGVTPTTEEPTMALSSTMNSDSLSFSSDSNDSEDSGESNASLSPSEDDEGSVGSDSDVSQESDSGVVELESDDTDDADAQGGSGRNNNVFDANGQASTSSTAMVWKYMWGVVAVFGVVNIAICYCMFRSRNQMKRGAFSFQKVESEVEIL